MNEAFGTDVAHWRELAEHSKRYRHGTGEGLVLLGEQVKKDLLGLAAEAVKRMTD